MVGVQTSNGRPVGFQIVNPFNRDAPPINVNFAQQKPYFQLPDTGRPGPGSNPFYNFAENNNLPRLPNMPRPPGMSFLFSFVATLDLMPT
jgi:hypothetical protein